MFELDLQYLRIFSVAYEKTEDLAKELQSVGCGDLDAEGIYDRISITNSSDSLFFYYLNESLLVFWVNAFSYYLLVNVILSLKLYYNIHNSQKIISTM